MSDPEIHCSFCGKREHEVWRLIAGPGVYVCSDCVGVSVQILSAESPDGSAKAFKVVSRLPDGTVQRSEHGPLPEVGPSEQGKHRWLKLCPTCGVWNVGTGLTVCLDCGAELANSRQ